MGSDVRARSIRAMGAFWEPRLPWTGRTIELVGRPIGGSLISESECEGGSKAQGMDARSATQVSYDAKGEGDRAGGGPSHLRAHMICSEARTTIGCAVTLLLCPFPLQHNTFPFFFFPPSFAHI